MAALSTQTIRTLCATSVLFLGCGLFAQSEHQPPSAKPDAPHARARSAKAEKHAGDPYPFSDCPVSGDSLTAMGEPVIKVYDGREIRFCCGECPAIFEKDLSRSMAKLDERIIKDQAAIYPLTTSVVTGEVLTTSPYQMVYANRLIRLNTEEEKAVFMKDPPRYMKALDMAAAAAQGKDYSLHVCAVSGEPLEGDGAMGKPIDVVVAGRLVRLCCNGCKKQVESSPAKYVSMVDAARKASHDSSSSHDSQHSSDSDSQHSSDSDSQHSSDSDSQHSSQHNSQHDSQHNSQHNSTHGTQRKSRHN